MWLTKQLISADRAGAVSGLFTQSGDKFTLESGEPLPLGGMLLPYGYCAMPMGCTEAVAIPNDGEHLLAGTITRSIDLRPGEIMIQSVGGAYIHLMASGEIVLNGVRITRDGQIITPSN